MVDKPADVSSIPPQIPQKPLENEKQPSKVTTNASYSNPFPTFQFSDSEIGQKEFVKKFWESMERNIGDCINRDMKRMKEANEKLKKSLEGKED